MKNFYENIDLNKKYYAAQHIDFGGDSARMRRYFKEVYSHYGRLPKDADPRLKFLKENLNRAASRENAWEVKIDVFDCWMIGEQQNWLCAVTKEPLSFVRGGTYYGGKWSNPMSCTIDRIDSTKGYVKGNIQLVTWKYNRWKNDFSDEELLLFSESTIKYFKNKVKNNV